MEQHIFKLTALVICCITLLLAILIIGMVWRKQKISRVIVVTLALFIVFALALYNFREAAPGTQIEMDWKAGKFKLGRDK